MPSHTSYLAAAALLLASAASALPSGVPLCVINPEVVAAAHGTPSFNGTYTLAASQQTYTPGQSLKVTISGKLSILGLLMYATPDTESDVAAADDSAPTHVGKFDLEDGFRAQNAELCKAADVINETPQSTITHANKDEKGANGKVTFTWTAPAEDIGPVAINALVSNGGPDVPWEILDVLVLEPAGAPADPKQPATLYAFTVPSPKSTAAVPSPKSTAVVPAPPKSIPTTTVQSDDIRKRPAKPTPTRPPTKTPAKKVTFGSPSRPTKPASLPDCKSTLTRAPTTTINRMTTATARATSIFAPRPSSAAQHDCRPVTSLAALIMAGVGTLLAMI
ncbi:hypothetical protein DFS34DRAFT_588915 [Phlyctochytrium arcticum]|nr:hypothetical protein DFS34DRAFT_588915 [Phlyctochytrium arcticum]